MHKSKETLNSLAKIASDAYLAKKSTPLNTSLKKIAESEELAPHQIEYVAGQANQMVWAQLYKKDKSAAYDFPIADPNEVVSELQTKEASVVSTADLDYAAAPSDMVKVARDMSVMGEFSTEITANNGRRELRATLESRMQKLAQLRERISDEICAIESKLETNVANFVREARTLVMQTPFSDRDSAFDKIAEFVRGSTKDVEIGRTLMRKLSEESVRSGLVKKAGLRAPEEYISETLPARIVNGNHTLYIMIDTIGTLRQEALELARRRELVDSTLPVLREKIRAL